MRLRVECVLACDAASAWREECKIGHWLAMSRPLLAFVPLRPSVWPEHWSQDLDLLVQSRLFGILPLGRHRIRVLAVDHGQWRIATEERGGAIRQWSHVVQIQAIDDSACRYCDRIDLEAGALTLPLGLFASLSYRLRHARWRRFARHLKRGSQP